MTYFYLFLSIVPSLVIIPFLIFNENSCKKYDVKKAIQSLCSGIGTILVISASEIIQRYYICTRIMSKQIPITFFLLIYAFGVLAPVIALNRSKLNRKKDILDEKWFCFVIIAVLIVFVIFAPGFILNSRI